MHYPIPSLIFSFVFWLSLIAASFCIKTSKISQPEIFLEVDASMVGEVEQEQQLTKFYSGKIGEIPQQEPKKSEKVSENSSAKIAQKQLQPLFQPLPKIPDELREEAFKSQAVARFYITRNGNVAKVELIEPSSNARLNSLLLSSLKRWKFTAEKDERKSSDGDIGEAAISSTQEVRVRFAVEE